MSFKIENIGPQSTIQDGGRFGYMAYGFSQNGVIDWKALALANILVDNDTDEAVIEMNFMGMSGVFETDTIFSLTGADCSPTLNGNPISMYQAVYATKGDILKSSYCKNGARTYMAFHKGLKIDSALGSKSTNLKCGIGGFMGRALKKDDILELNTASPKIYYLYSRKIKNPYAETADNTLRVVMGPQDEYFTDKGINTFLTKEYKLTKDCDRMGLKLEGEAIESKKGTDIVSDGIPFGAIQIPANGQPIIMLADRQTTGGYAKIAVVIYLDFPKLARLKTGDTVRFKKISIEEAQDCYIEEKKKLEILRKQWTI